MKETAEDVAGYVRDGIRERADLLKCGCSTCKKALKILDAMINCVT